jgi:hypothetical protein
MKNIQIDNFVFNDGIKQQQVFKEYDGWFTSTNYDDYSKSYVIVNEEKIILFDNTKELKVGKNFDLQSIEDICKNYNLDILCNEIGVKCVAKFHVFDRFFITEKNEYKVIYSIGGTKSFEYIYIHGVWKNNFLV